MYSGTCLNVILIIALWTVVVKTNLTNIKKEDNINRLIVNHLTYIVLNSTKDQRNILVQSKGVNYESEKELQILANSLIKNNLDNAIILGDVERIDKYYHINIRLLFVDSVSSFEYLFDKHKNITAVESTEVFYLIVLRSVDNLGQLSNFMEKMFDTFFAKMIVNANILLYSAKIGIEMFTYFPYSSGACYSKKPVKIYGDDNINFRTKKTMMFNNFYPAKDLNFNGCPLKISIAPIKPFITLHPSQVGHKRISGIEGKMLQLIATKLNFSYQIFIYDYQHPGFVRPDLITSGVFTELAEGRVDFALGGTSCSHYRMRLLSCSKPYFMSKVRVMLKPGEHFTTLEILFYPFKLESWLLLLLLVNLRLIWKVFQKHVTVNQGLAQLMIITWLLTIFFYRISFEGSYFKFLHNQPLKPLPSNAEEMKKQKYFVLSDLCTRRFREYYDDLNLVVVVRLTPWETISFIKNAKEKYAALVSTEMLTYYLSKNPEERGNFLIIKEGMILDPLCIYFVRNSYLVDTFDKILMDLDTHGIINKLVREYVNYNYIPSTTDETDSLIQRERAALELRHLSAAFYLLALFLFTATMIFVFERLSNKFVLLKKFFDYVGN